MNKNVMLLIPILIGIMLLPLMSAVTTMSPGVGGNVSAITITVTNGAMNYTNITCYYNASGGDSFPKGNVTFLTTILNTSYQQTTFTKSISGLVTEKPITTFGGVYNVTCALFNGIGMQFNDTVNAYNVTFDATAPTNGISLESEHISSRDSILISWAYADATSSVYSYNTTITPPTGSSCAIVDEGAVTSGTDSLVDDQTSCKGTYTVTALVTDYAGNSNNITKTFTVYQAGLNKAGSGTLGGTAKSNLGQKGNVNLPLGESGTNIAIIVGVGAALWLFLKRKN